MKTFTINMPQTLRARLQTYQNDQKIEQPEVALLAALEAYFQDWTPTKKAPPLPAMYDAEDGPCEVVRSFIEPSDSETSDSETSGQDLNQTECC
ncbi:MAG: hypothetical protein AAFQ63_06730 [Cyanobacteria bacterium J06621_11]